MSTPSSSGGRRRQISIACYTLQVRPKRTTKSGYEPLGAFADGKGDLHAFMFSFLEKLQTDWHDAPNSAMHGIDRLEASRWGMWGVIRSGDHGHAASLVDVTSGKRSYDRKPTDAEMLPFYFRLALPPEARRGLLLVQRFGSRGAFGAFRAALRDRFDEKWPSHTVEISAHVPQQALDILQRGKVTRMQFRNVTPPADVADKVDWGDMDSSGATWTLTLQAKRRSFLPRPAFLRRAAQPGIVELVGVDEDTDPHRVSVTLRDGGVQRTVQFGSKQQMLPYLDCTSDVTIGDNGHPTYDSIHEYSRGLERDLLKFLGVHVKS